MTDGRTTRFAHPTKPIALRDPGIGDEGVPSRRGTACRVAGRSRGLFVGGGRAAVPPVAQGQACTAAVGTPAPAPAADPGAGVAAIAGPDAGGRACRWRRRDSVPARRRCLRTVPGRLALCGYD